MTLFNKLKNLAKINKGRPNTVYWIAHTSDYSVVHYDETKPSEQTESGLILEVHNAKSQRDNVLIGLGITPGNGAGSKNK